MNKISFLALALVALMMLTPSAVLAQTKTKIIITLPEFRTGKEVVIDKPIDKDLMVAGGQNKINTDIKGDVYVAGGQIEISGTIGGNLIVAGGQVTLSGKVAKNLIAAGGQIKITDSATVGGYTMLAGGNVNLFGNFDGPVKVGAGELVVGDNTKINGDLVADVGKNNFAATASVSGAKKIQLHEVKKPEASQKQWRTLSYLGEIYSFISRLIILLIIVKIFNSKSASKLDSNAVLSLLGAGLLVFIATPALAVTLMITIFAFPVGVLLLVAYFIGLYLSGIMASIFIGKYVSKSEYLKIDNIYIQGSIGLLLLTIVGLIPVVGGLIKFICLLLGLGIIFSRLRLAILN